VYDVSPLEICDVLVVQPYILKHHTMYDSRTHNVIVSLEGHLYILPEVALTIINPLILEK
jgi:hypothetical protein